LRLFCVSHLLAAMKCVGAITVVAALAMMLSGCGNNGSEEAAQGFLAQSNVTTNATTAAAFAENATVNMTTSVAAVTPPPNASSHVVVTTATPDANAIANVSATTMAPEENLTSAANNSENASADV